MKYLFTLMIAAVGNTYSYGQKFSASFNAQLAVPEGDYKQVNADAGYGLRGNILFRPSYNVPIKFGLELGIQEKARATEYFSGYVYGYYDDFRESASSNIFSLMLVARFQSPATHKIKPFVDVIAGWNVFFSTVSVDDLTYYGNYDPSYSHSTKAHWAFAYGPVGGLDIPLNKQDDIGMELKVAYLIGSYTTYLTDPYINANGDVSFKENNSRTNMLIPQAGVRITIH